MSDTCPEHGLPTRGVCASCVRPLCPKCPVEGVVPRCMECQMASVQGGSFSTRSREGLGTGGLIFILLLIGAGLYLSTLKACPLSLPGGLEWKH